IGVENCFLLATRHFPPPCATLVRPHSLSFTLDISEAPVNREQFYAIMNGEGTLDYEKYLNTKTLLGCQSDFADLCNPDEMQFQIVHQVEELWMKLIAYTLLDIDDYLQQENTNRVLTLFRRVHAAQRLMIQQIGLLETMSPKEYQDIRQRL